MLRSVSLSWALKMIQLLIILLYLTPLSKQQTQISLRVYQEIRKLETSCFSKHGCHTRKKPLLNCKCDSDCSIYGDCCKYSEFLQSMQQNRQDIKCINGYYIKTKCPPTWENQEVRDQCEILHKNVSDPLSTIPVVSLETNISYRNHYCAICNNDWADIESWKIQLACPRVPSGSIFQGFEYNETSLSWMARVIYNSSEEIYKPCILKALPYFASNSSVTIRKCHSDTSQCAADWSDDYVKEKCLSYQGIICTRRRCYRNAFCAVCNNEPLETAECKDLEEHTEGDGINLEDFKDETDSEGLERACTGFGLHCLFTFKSKENEKCKKNQVWDHALQVCHTLFSG